MSVSKSVKKHKQNMRNLKKRKVLSRSTSLRKLKSLLGANKSNFVNSAKSAKMDKLVINKGYFEMMKVINDLIAYEESGSDDVDSK